MSWKTLAAGLCVLAAVAAAVVLATARHHHTTYYLALGGSLALGVQPNASGAIRPTDQGFVNDILVARRHRIKGLELEQLACAGETTAAMINGPCPFARAAHHSTRPQLARAVAFIKSHKVAFITLDVGADDLAGCARSGGLRATCAGLATVKANVPRIVNALRKAAGPHTPIVAMTYYDPFLAAYLRGGAGRTLAARSVRFVRAFNDELASGFAAAQVKVADVPDAFDSYVPFSTTTTVRGLGTVPLAVAQICAHTWSCTPPPRGPNEHANTSGYALIAGAFEKEL